MPHPQVFCVPETAAQLAEPQFFSAVHEPLHEADPQLDADFVSSDVFSLLFVNADTLNIPAISNRAITATIIIVFILPPV